MRCAYPWMLATMLATACGSATPLGDTSGDDTSTSSTTVLVTSNDGENTTVPFTTDDTGSASTETGTSTTMDPTTGTDATTTTEGSTDTDESSSTGAVDDTSSSGSSDSTGRASDCIDESGCAAGCEVEFACGMGEWKSAQECTDWCEENLVIAEEFGCFCAQAWNNLSSCFAPLTCEEYAEYLEPTMFPYPCSIESDSLQFECKGQ